MLADLFQSARLAAVETEAQLEDLPLALVEWRQQTSDLLREQSGGGDLERGLGRTVFDHISQFGVTVLAQRLAE